MDLGLLFLDRELLTKYADDLLQFCSLAVPRLLEVLCNSMKCGTAGVKQVHIMLCKSLLLTCMNVQCMYSTLCCTL